MVSFCIWGKLTTNVAKKQFTMENRGMKKLAKRFYYLSFILVTFFAGNFCLAVESASVETFHTTGGKVEFFAIGRPSMLKVHGTAKSLEGTGTVNKKTNEIFGHFVLKMDDFSTSLGLRDSHLKNKVFEVEKYPVSELTFKSIVVKPGEKTKVPAVLKFHGVEKEVLCETTLIYNNDKTSIESSF